MQNELRMNEEKEKIFKKGDGDLIEVLSLKFAVGNEEKKNFQVCQLGFKSVIFPKTLQRFTITTSCC